MGDISLIQGMNIKDTVARNGVKAINETISNIFANTSNKFTMIGDSIGEGYGWWGGNVSNKTNDNDGFFAILRDEYPNTSFTNLSVSGSTIANIPGYSSLQSQVGNVSSDTTHLFVLTGINDVTYSMRDKVNYVGYPMDKVMESQYISDLYTSTCLAFESNINALLRKNNNMKIYFIIEPTIDQANYDIYDMCFSYLKFICDKYGVNVIDFRKMFRKYNDTNSRQYFNDKVHPNENGYRLMYNYLKNHIIYDINDNFKETPNVLVIDSDIDFSSYETAIQTAKYIAKEIGGYAPMWQQDFSALVLSSKSWGSNHTKVAGIRMTFNYTLCKINISSLAYTNNYEFQVFVTTTKNSQSQPTPTVNTYLSIVPNYYTEGVINQMHSNSNITSVTQLVQLGTYCIPANLLPNITDMTADLKNSSNGFAICENITGNSQFYIQRWTSLFNNSNIYMCFINRSNGTVKWRKIPLETV